MYKTILYFLTIMLPFNGLQEFQTTLQMPYEFNEQFNSERIRPYINTNGFAITSLTFNPTNEKSEWIQSLLGDRAIYYNRSVGNFTRLKRLIYRLQRPLNSDEEEHLIKENMSNIFKLPASASNAPCSVEMLGFGRVIRGAIVIEAL